MSREYTAEELYQVIGVAFRLLHAYPFAEIAASLRQQEEAAFYLDPTLAQKLISKEGRANMERQYRLLDAAATFVAEVRNVAEDLGGEQ